MTKECTQGATLGELLTRPLHTLMLRGSDGTADGAKPDADAQDGDNDGAKPGGADEDKSKDNDGKDGAKPTAEERRWNNLEEDRNRNRDGRLTAEAEVKDLKKQIAKMEKDGTPDDALKSQNDELTKTNATLVSQIAELRLKVAFFTESSYDWVDPEAALRLADLSEVEQDEKTNKVVGLKVSLDKLAKEKPYLLKPKKEEDKEDEDGKPKPRRTGNAPRPGSQKEADKAAREAKLRQKYPALRR